MNGSHASHIGKALDADHLVGSAEIAERLNVKRPQVIHDWRRRHPEFPEPVARLSLGFIWYWPDVESWARETGRIED